MTATMQTPMMTIEAVAERMSVSDRTVFRWIKSGCLKAFRTGRVLRVSEEDLADFIANQTPTWVLEHRQSRQ